MISHTKTYTDRNLFEWLGLSVQKIIEPFEQLLLSVRKKFHLLGRQRFSIQNSKLFSLLNSRGFLTSPLGCQTQTASSKIYVYMYVCMYIRTYVRTAKGVRSDSA